MTTLRDFTIGPFMAQHYHGESGDVRRTYRNAVERFDTFLGRSSLPSDLTHEAYATFKEWLGLNYSKNTKRGTIDRLRTVWRAVAADGLTSTEPPRPVYSGNGLLPLTEHQQRVRRPMPDALEGLPIKLVAKPETLRDYVRMYALERGLGRRSEQGLHHTINNLEKHLGHVATFADLGDMTLNVWLAALLASGMAPVTVKSHRKCVLSLWRAAHEGELVDQLPRRVRKVKVPSAAPQAWTREQVQRLLAVCRKLPGVMRNDPRVRRAHFWTCLVAVAYSSGLRKGDLIALRWDQIDASGTLTANMAKTGDRIDCRLPADLVKLLGKLRPEAHDRVFGDLLGRDAVTHTFQRIAHTAGLPGSLKWLRRTGATAVEAQSPGAAKAFLGHRTHGLAAKNYLDPRLLQSDKPMPPALDLVGT